MLVAAPYSQVHAARPDDPPFWLRTLRRANPSFDHLPSLAARIHSEIVDAKTDPGRVGFVQGPEVEPGRSDVVRSVLVDAAAWQRACELDRPGSRSPSYVLGIDLGTNAAMSAAAGFFRSGHLEAFGVFPELPGLRERGLADGVGLLYQRMADRDELLQAGRRVSDVRALLVEVLERWGRPQAIVLDRRREAELLEHLEALRFPLARVIVRGMGYRDGSADVRGFRAAVLAGLVRPSESLLLTAALAEARVATDPAGNAKLTKGSEGGRRQLARDDAAAAAVPPSGTATDGGTGHRPADGGYVQRWSASAGAGYVRVPRPVP